MEKIDPKEIVRVVIADDHALFREGLRKILELEGGIKIVGEASDGSETLQLVDRLKPDVILMDINFPGPNGIRITRQIKRRRQNVYVIMLSMYEDTGHIVESFQAGASGYVIKTCPSGELIQIIRSVCKEGVSIPPAIEHKLLKGIREPEFLGGRKRVNLTRREVKVLKLVASGNTNKQIAKRLFVSEKTVKNDLNHIYRKLRVKNRPQAAAEALKKNYMSME